METVKKIPGMTTCVICGRDFPLIEWATYIARGETKIGLTALVDSNEPTLYDAIDCPHCGCQNALQERKRVASLEDLGYDVVEEEVDEDDE